MVFCFCWIIGLFLVFFRGEGIVLFDHCQWLIEGKISRRPIVSGWGGGGCSSLADYLSVVVVD